MSIKKIFTKYSLVILVLLIIFAVVLWMAFSLLPDANKMKDEVDALQVKYNTLKAKTVDDKKLIADLAESMKVLKEYEKKFPAIIKQGSTLRDVQSLELESGFEVISMGYERLQYDTLNQPVEEKKADGSVSIMKRENGVLLPAAGKGMKIPIKTQFSSNYEELKNYVTLIDKSEQRIGLREIQISTDRSKEEKIIKGSMILEFYGFMPEEDLNEDTKTNFN